MIIDPDFEIVDIVDEYLAVPIGEKAKSFNGVVALSAAAAFLLKNMNNSKSKQELVELLTAEYNVEESVAKADVDKMVEKLLDMGVIKE